MSAPWMPPLPLPDLGGWERTDAQVAAYGLACYLQAIEDAAKVCDDLASGHQFVHDSRAESSTDECANAIRRLKDTP